MLSISVAQPFPFETMLRYLSLRCTPAVETLGIDRYSRKTSAGVVTVEFDASRGMLRCSGEGAATPEDLVRRVRHLFDTDCDTARIGRVLAHSPALRSRVRKLRGVRVPGCWEPFELCLRVILGQQVSVAAAHTLMGRLVAACSGEPTPVRVAAADWGSIGLTGARVRSIRTLSERVADGTIRLDGQSWEEVAGRLREVPGFGPWTLAYLALRLGRDADSFPETDLGLLRAAGVTRPAELKRMAEAWRPYRGYAAMYLWATQISHTDLPSR